VANVNDAPVIHRVEPASGTTFDEGERVHFIGNASDEDGDALTYAWWDGDRQFGTGQVLDFGDLSAGDHTVRLVVTDGNESVSQELVLHVMATTPSIPGRTLSWLLVLTVMGIVTCLGVWRWHKSQR